MKWFILLAVTTTNEIAPSPPAFFGETACERARHEYVALGVSLDKTKCTPRHVK